MEGYGWHEEGCGLVQRGSRGEGEQTEWRGGPGTVLSSRFVAHRGRGLRVPAEMAVVATGGGLGLSVVLVGVA